MEYIFLFLADVIVGGLALFVAGKLIDAKIEFKDASIAVAAAALMSLIPSLGWLLSTITLFYLLKRFSGAPIWPDILLMVLVSRLVVILALAALTTLGVF